MDGAFAEPQSYANKKEYATTMLWMEFTQSSKILPGQQPFADLLTKECEILMNRELWTEFAEFLFNGYKKKDGSTLAFGSVEQYLNAAMAVAGEFFAYQG